MVVVEVAVSVSVEVKGTVLVEKVVLVYIVAVGRIEYSSGGHGSGTRFSSGWFSC
jgi:hypothetical protein